MKVNIQLYIIVIVLNPSILEKNSNEIINKNLNIDINKNVKTIDSYCYLPPIDKKIKVKKLNEKAKLPSAQTEYAAASDLYACLDGPLTVYPGEWRSTSMIVPLPSAEDDTVAPEVSSDDPSRATIETEPSAYFPDNP